MDNWEKVALLRILRKNARESRGPRETRTVVLGNCKMNARELKRILRKQTRCSRRHMVVLDKEYSPISTSSVQTLTNDYEKAAYIPEIWDCDDIARDFVNFTARDFLNFVKRRVKNVFGKNVAFGMLVFRDHAQEIFVEETQNASRRNTYTVYYMDHRYWGMYKPNKRPKWIVI